MSVQNHEGFQVQNSTTIADAHLLRLFLAVQSTPKHILASLVVSNAFLNADLSDDVTILTQPAPGQAWYSLPMCKSMSWFERRPQREEARDKTLTSFLFHIEGEEFSLRQSAYHPSVWFVVKAPVCSASLDCTTA